MLITPETIAKLKTAKTGDSFQLAGTFDGPMFRINGATLGEGVLVDCSQAVILSPWYHENLTNWTFLGGVWRGPAPLGLINCKARVTGAVFEGPPDRSGTGIKASKGRLTVLDSTFTGLKGR